MRQPITNAFRTPFAWLALIVATGLGVAAAIGHVEGDFNHMLRPANAALSGDFGAIYPEGVPGTSLGGWLLLTLPSYAPLRALAGERLGWALAGLVALPLALAGVVALARALGPRAPWSAVWQAGAIGLVLPTTLACWFEWYHPQDLAGAGVMLLGLAAAVRKRWVAAGLLLGLAVAIRQWVGLVAILVAPFAGAQLGWYALAGVGAVAALTFPLVAAGNPGLLGAATGQSAARSRNTLLGRLTWFDPTNSVAPHFLRLLPAGVAGIGAVALWLRRVRGTRWLLTAAMTGLALRLCFEPAAFLYYWVPVPLLVLGLAGRSRWALAAGALLGVAPAAIPWVSEVANGALVPGVIFVLAGTAVLATWHLAGVGDGEAEVPERCEDGDQPRITA